MLDAFRRRGPDHDPKALCPGALEQFGQGLLEGLRRKVVKADLCQGYALPLLVVLRDELVEKPDAERGGALWHRGGILGGPRHPRDVEVCPGDIIDKALKKLRAENASGGATTAYIFHVSRVAVDLAVVTLVQRQPPDFFADNFARCDQLVCKLVVIREPARAVMS